MAGISNAELALYQLQDETATAGTSAINEGSLRAPTSGIWADSGKE